jgi:hypothetical protein
VATESRPATEFLNDAEARESQNTIAEHPQPVAVISMSDHGDGSAEDAGMVIDGVWRTNREMAAAEAMIILGYAPVIHSSVRDDDVSKNGNVNKNYDSHRTLGNSQDRQLIEVSPRSSSSTLVGCVSSSDGSLHSLSTTSTDTGQLLQLAWEWVFQHRAVTDPLRRVNSEGKSPGEIVCGHQERKPVAVVFDPTVTKSLSNLSAISNFGGKAFSEPSNKIEFNQKYISKDVIEAMRPDGGLFERQPIFKPFMSREPLFSIKNRELAKAR